MSRRLQVRHAEGGTGAAAAVAKRVEGTEHRARERECGDTNLVGVSFTAVLRSYVNAYEYDRVSIHVQYSAGALHQRVHLQQRRGRVLADKWEIYFEEAHSAAEVRAREGDMAIGPRCATPHAVACLLHALGLETLQPLGV